MNERDNEDLKVGGARYTPRALTDDEIAARYDQIVAKYTEQKNPAPQAASTAPKIQDRQLLIVCVGLLAWLAGFMTAVMLFSDRGEAKSPTPREQQIERYEELGK